MDNKAQEWNRRRALMVTAWENFQEAARCELAPVFERMREIGRSPVWLDLRMMTGGYEEDIAESHGGAEDVWV